MELLASIPAKPVPAVLDSLAALAERRADGDDGVTVPMVTLFIRGAGAVTGWVLKQQMDDKRGPVVVLQHAQADRREPGADISYLDPGMIHAVTLFTAEESARALWPEQGRSAPVRTQVPGRLELTRQAQELAAALKSISGWTGEAQVADPGAGPDETLFRLSQALRNLRIVLADLLADPMAKEAFHEKVQRLSVTHGDRPSVALKDGVLVVTVSAHPAHWLGKTALRQGISAAL